MPKAKTHTHGNVLALAARYDLLLRADDPRFNRGAVTITTDDGTCFVLPSAFSMTTGNFIVVFTEHYRYYVFDKDDLTLHAEDVSSNGPKMGLQILNERAFTRLVGLNKIRAEKSQIRAEKAKAKQ